MVVGAVSPARDAISEEVSMIRPSRASTLSSTTSRVSADDAASVSRKEAHRVARF
jgi:hypothetical protein